jgi:hypothetical protein
MWRRNACESFSGPAGGRAYEKHVNPQSVALLNLLDMNVQYERRSGCEPFTPSMAGPHFFWLLPEASA